MPLPLIIAAVGAAASVASSAMGASKADKQRWMTQQLTFLSNEQKLKLEKDLASAKTVEERNKLINDALSVVAAARVKGLTTLQVEKEKTKKQLIIAGIVGAVLIVITIIAIKKSK